MSTAVIAALVVCVPAVVALMVGMVLCALRDEASRGLD